MAEKIDELLENTGLLHQPEQDQGHGQTHAAESGSCDQAADGGDEFEHTLPQQVPAPSAPLATERMRLAQPEPEIEAADPATTDATDAAVTLGLREKNELELAHPEAPAVEESGHVVALLSCIGLLACIGLSAWRGSVVDDLGAGCWMALCLPHAAFWLWVLVNIALDRAHLGTNVREALVPKLEEDNAKTFVLVAACVLAAWGGASLARSGWAAVVIAGVVHLPVLGMIPLDRRQLRACVLIAKDSTDLKADYKADYIGIAFAAPLCVVMAPPIALGRLGLGQLGVSISILAILALSVVYLWHQSKSGNLRETYHGPEDEAAEQEAEDGVKADQRAAAKDGAKMMRAAVFPPVAEVPTGSGKMIFGVTLEIITFQSIAFIPSMPTLNLNFRGVPEWARWWVDMNTTLKAVLGDFAAIFGSWDLQTWLTGLMSDMNGPSVNLYLVKFAAIVICSCVLFPWHMRRLGLKKTSADQAAFVVIAYEAAAMFVIKNIVGGLICTDYSDRHFVTMQSVTGSSDVEAGTVVYLTAEGFTATEPIVDAATMAFGWVYWAVTGSVFVLACVLTCCWTRLGFILRNPEIKVERVWGLTCYIVLLLAGYGGIRASTIYASSDYLYGRTLKRTWQDSAVANATTGCPLSVNASEVSVALENCTLHPIQIEGAWLDDAGWAPGQAIKCSWSTQHVVLIYVAVVAFAVYLGQVLSFAVIYGKKSSVIVFDQRYMLCSLLLKMALSVATAAIGTCHPNWLLVIEGVVVGANLVMLMLMSPCNIRTLDHIKVAGLYNVLFTLSVTGWVAVALSGGNEPCNRDERYAAAEAVDAPLQTQVLCIGGLFFAVVLTPAYITLRKRLDNKKDAESKTLEAIFKGFDKDKSKNLDRQEARDFCKYLGQDLDDNAFEEQWRLMNNIGVDEEVAENDTVDFTEFKAYYNEHATDAPSQLTITDFNYSNITQALTRLLPSTEETDEEQQPLWRQLIPSEITAIVEKAAQALEFATRLVGRLCNRSKVGVSQRAATRATELKKEADDMVKGRKFADAAKAYGEAAELDPDEESSNNLRELEARAKQRIPKLTIDVSEYTGTEQLELATLRMLIASEVQVDFVGLDLTSEGAQIMLNMLDERPVHVKLKRLENKLRRVASLGMLGAPPMICGGPVAVAFRKLVFKDAPEKALNSLTKLSDVVGQLSSENRCSIKLLRPDLSALRDMTFAADVDARHPTFWMDDKVLVAGVNEIAQAIQAGIVVNSVTVNSTLNVDSVTVNSTLNVERDINQKTYTLATGQDKIELNNKNLGPADINLISAWLTTGASAAVARLSLSGNFITGSTNNINNIFGYSSAKYDNDLSGLIALCDVLPTLKNPVELDLSNCGLSVNGVNQVAKTISAGAVIDEVNVSKNPIGVDGAKALAEVLPDSSLKCLIIGPKSTRLPVNDAEVTELNFEGQDFTPAEVTLVAAATSTMASLNSVTVDSTGDTKNDNGGPKTYMLTTGEEKIDLSRKNLGSADVALVAAWLQRPEVSAAVARLILDENPLTGGRHSTEFTGVASRLEDITGVAALCDTLKTSSVTELGLAKCRLGPGSLGKLVEYVREATAAITEVDVRKNLAIVSYDGVLRRAASSRDAPARCIILTDHD